MCSAPVVNVPLPSTIGTMLTEVSNFGTDSVPNRCGSTDSVGGGGTIQPGNARADTIVNNLLAVVFDPARLTAQEFVEQEADAMLDYLRSTPPAAGRQVRVAGEPESASKLARAASGVPVDGNTWSQLCELAAATGVRPPPTSNG